MWFFKVNFHRYCAPKPRNASALLTFLPCLGKNFLLKNCFAPDGFVFLVQCGASLVKLYCRKRDKKCLNVPKNKFFRHIGFDSHQLNRYVFKSPPKTVFRMCRRLSSIRNSNLRRKKRNRPRFVLCAFRAFGRNKRR